MGSVPAQINIRRTLMEESINNPNLFLLSTNKRIEKMREQEESSSGNQSFKSFIIEQEKQKLLRAQIASSHSKNQVTVNNTSRTNINQDYLTPIKEKVPLRATSVNKIKIPMVKMNVNLLSSRSNNKQDDFPTDPKDDRKS